MSPRARTDAGDAQACGGARGWLQTDAGAATSVEPGAAPTLRCARLACYGVGVAMSIIVTIGSPAVCRLASHRTRGSSPAL